MNCEACGAATAPTQTEKGRWLTPPRYCPACSWGHRHVWTYTTSIAGWTLARCECGAVELA